MRFSNYCIGSANGCLRFAKQLERINEIMIRS